MILLDPLRWIRLVLALLPTVFLVENTQGAGTSRPNIIIMMADDMGFSDIGCYGGEIRTPHLDQLASRGLRFTQFYNTARCCPTRASLLTGLYQHQAGVGHMMGDRNLEGYRGNLNRQCMTIAEVMKENGYGTYMSGKWHVTRHTAPEGPKFNWPRQRGFDRFFGTIHGAGSFFDPNSLTLDNTQIPPGDDFYYTDAISDQAASFIRGHQASHPDDPFFLYVAYTAPHWPMQAKPKDMARYRGRYDSGWDVLRGERHERMVKMGLVDATWPLTPRDRQAPAWEDAKMKEWECRLMEVYASMVDCMDQGIGRVLEAVKDTGQWDNTLVLFLADNGGCAENMGRNGPLMPRPDQPVAPMAPETLQTDMIPKFTRAGYPVRQGRGVMAGPADTYMGYGLAWANASNTPFREYKHWVHEGGISSPLIAHWPGGIPESRQGEWETQSAHLIDLMATCVDVSGATYPERYRGEAIQPLEGVSLLPAFKGEDVSRANPIFWEHEGNRAVRQGRWKLVAKGPAGAWELYDMEKDRTELNDLAGQNPGKVRELVAAWEAWARRARVLPWIWQPAYGQPQRSPGSDLKKFSLKQGDDLGREQSPRIQNRPFTLEVTLKEYQPEGIIVAQGGSHDGFALYLQEGNLIFAMRRSGHLDLIRSGKPLDAKVKRVQVELTRGYDLILRADGKRVGKGTLEGTMNRMPLDGLQVGRDLNGAVGEYKAPFEYQGTIEGVGLELKKPWR